MTGKTLQWFQLIQSQKGTLNRCEHLSDSWSVQLLKCVSKKVARMRSVEVNNTFSLWQKCFRNLICDFTLMWDTWNDESRIESTDTTWVSPDGYFFLSTFLLLSSDDKFVSWEQVYLKLCWIIMKTELFHLDICDTCVNSYYLMIENKLIVWHLSM